jgi:hypothetical protein
MRAGISPHTIDHISLIKIAGSQNIIGIAVISFWNLNARRKARFPGPPSKRALAERQHGKGPELEHGREFAVS